MTFSTEKLKRAGAAAGLRYKVRSGVFENYKASAVFDPKNVHATSYRWWNAVQKIGPFVLFNACSYSNQTAKHLGKFRHLMSELGIKTDFHIYAGSGLQRMSTDHVRIAIENVKASMSKRGSHKELNKIRVLELVEMNLEAEIIEKLLLLDESTGPKRAGLIRSLRTLKTKLKKAKQATQSLRSKRYEAMRERRRERFQQRMERQAESLQIRNESGG